MDASHVVLILLALVGFFLLAALVIVPVYLFLKREKRVSEQWTPEALARRMRETRTSANGAASHDEADHPSARS